MGCASRTDGANGEEVASFCPKLLLHQRTSTHGKGTEVLHEMM